MAFGLKEDVVVELRLNGNELSVDISFKERAHKLLELLRDFKRIIFGFGGIAPEPVVRATRVALRYVHRSAPLRLDEEPFTARLFGYLKADVRAVLNQYGYSTLSAKSFGKDKNFWKLVARGPTDLMIEMDLAMADHQEELQELADVVRDTYEYYRGKRCARG